METILLSLYIFSWQFPHFYGILYENKEDYKKAGFSMISNSDPTGQRAFTHILLCNIVNSLLPLLMLQTGMINPLFLGPFYYYQAKSIKSVFEFKNNEANANSAKKLKRASYMPFIILLCGFTATTTYNRYQKRSQKKKEVQGMLE